MSIAAPTAPSTRRPIWVAGVVVLGALVALTVGLVAGRQNSPSYAGFLDLWIFEDTIHMKVWLATAAALGASVQLFLAFWIFRKLPWPRPAWVPAAHRWSGRVTFLLTLPVAYHCIFRLGFQDYQDRVLVHSLLGSSFFGAYVAKVSIVRLHRFPRWVLPTAGGLLFALVIGLWYTSAYWYFTTVDTKF